MDAFFALMEKPEAEEVFTSMDGIGTITAQSILEWFKKNGA